MDQKTLSLVHACPFWRLEDYHDLREVRCENHIAEIGLRVLKRQESGSDRPISQFCGPISTGGFGNFSQNFMFFGLHVQELRISGFNPFNQMPLEIGFRTLEPMWSHVYGKEYRKSILTMIYTPIFESGFVRQTWFSPLYRSSRGTVWERRKVGRLKIEVREFPRSWHDRIRQEMNFSSFHENDKDAVSLGAVA